MCNAYEQHVRWVRFSLLTTSPGADIAPHHDRQVLALKREDWATWLYLTAKPEAELLRPWAGTRSTSRLYVRVLRAERNGELND